MRGREKQKWGVSWGKRECQQKVLGKSGRKGGFLLVGPGVKAPGLGIETPASKRITDKHVVQLNRKLF